VHSKYSATTQFPDLVIVKGETAKPRQAYTGLTRRILAYNDSLMLTEHVMEEGAEFPRHSHPHQQLAYLISGHIRVFAGNEVFEAKAGDSFVLRGGIEHRVIALKKSVALDIFTPLREDYVNGA